MEIKFEKKGIIFNIEVDAYKTILTVDGIEVPVNIVKHPQNGWAYLINSNADKRIFKALGAPKPQLLYILDSSAEKALISQKHYKKEEKERQILAYTEGNKVIKTRLMKGDYLLGHLIFDDTEGELLVSLGLARKGTHGYRVNEELIKEIGEEFTYQKVLEFAKPALEERKKIEEARQSARKAKFDEARKTGNPVLLTQWSEECDDPNEDCDIDNIVVYAMPDGSTKTERHHTW